MMALFIHARARARRARRQGEGPHNVYALHVHCVRQQHSMAKVAATEGGLGPGRQWILGLYSLGAAQVLKLRYSMYLFFVYFVMFVRLLND